SGAKLLDFGLAKLSAKPPAEVIATTHAALTASGMILGTLHYMAPEQLQGEEVDERADIFSFGAIAYEMLAGRKAFDGNDAASVIAAILQREPEPIPTIAHGKWRNLEYVIRKCIAKNPDDRWQNAHDVLLQLRWIAQEHAETPQQAARARNSRFIGALVLCSVLAVISIISLAVVFRNSQGSFETYSEFPIHSPPNVPLLSPGFVSPD